MTTDHDLVFIKDWGQPEFLDGAQMQFAVAISDKWNTIAYCESLEIARLLANALTATNYNAQVVIVGSNWRHK